MNLKHLSFDDASFDHAFSICVFEHLDYEVKQAAISEIARVLKPEGMLSMTFDYRNPAPVLSGSGPDRKKISPGAFCPPGSSSWSATEPSTTTRSHISCIRASTMLPIPSVPYS